MNIDEAMSSPVIQREKIKVNSIYIIVSEYCNEPYYEIRYKEAGNNFYNIGYSSFNLEQVLYWKHHCFEVVPIDEDDRKDSKYRWHDLRKNPNDLPENEYEVDVVCERRYTNGKSTQIRTHAFYEDGTVLENDSIWSWEYLEGEYNEEEDCHVIPEGWWEYRHYNPNDCYNGVIDDCVIAWREIEPFKEK